MPYLVQTAPQPKVLFNFQGPSGASPGIAGAVEFHPELLPNGQGMKSDVYDLGTGIRSNLFEWRAKCTIRPGVPTVGGTLEIYLCTSDDGTNWDSNLGSGVGSITLQDKRRNLQWVGSVAVDQSASGVPFITSGLLMTHARMFSVVWYNYMGTQLSSIQGENLFELTPVPDSIEQF